MTQTVTIRQAKAIAVAAMATLVLGMAVPANAQIAGATTRYAGVSQETLSIPVYAQVGARCGFSSTGLPAPSGYSIPQPIDTTAWTKQFPFELECTGPFNVAVASLNGGLKNATTVSDPGYGSLAPYDVRLHVVAAGNLSATSPTCAASTLQGPGAASACTSFGGDATATHGFGLNAASLNLAGAYLEAFAPAYPGPDVLIQGTYRDTLTVTVSARTIP